jgi:hypothetical protein
MKVQARLKPRRALRKNYSLTWTDDGGLTHSSEAYGIDISDHGVGIRCPLELNVGTNIYIQAEDRQPEGYATVRHCARRGDIFVIGLELNQDTRSTVAASSDDRTDHYEFLQISPNAESATIHRIYRFLAARYHPDNPETGDPEKFLRLNQAFDVLSNPYRRSEYDATLAGKQAGPIPGFGTVDFMDGIEGEVNRRLAVLSVLYRKCRANVENPKVSLAELETLMGFPREYLDFTTWYLRTKKYINKEDNSDFALTVLGVDYVEANYSKIPVLRKLVNAGNPVAASSTPESSENQYRSEETFILMSSRPAAEDGGES